MKQSFAEIVQKAQLIYVDSKSVKQSEVDISSTYTNMRDGVKTLVGTFPAFNIYTVGAKNGSNADIYTLEAMRKGYIEININPMTEVEASRISIFPVYRVQEKDLSKWVYSDTNPEYTNIDYIYREISSGGSTGYGSSYTKQFFQYSVIKVGSGMRFAINLNIKMPWIGNYPWWVPTVSDILVDLYMMKV